MDAEEELLAAGRLSLSTGDSAGVVLAVLSRATVATLESDYQRALALHAYRSSVQGELQLPAAAEHQAVEEIAEARSSIGEELAERLWNAASKRTYAFITDDLGIATAQLEVPSS
jgi:hypothetical protein